MAKTGKFNWELFFKLTKYIPSGLDRKIKKQLVNQKTKLVIKEKYNNCCALCYSDSSLSIHHILPNGSNAVSNLVPLCWHCHNIVQELLYVLGKWRYVNITKKMVYLQ